MEESTLASSSMAMHRREEVGAHAPVLLGERQAEQAHLPHLADGVERELVGAVPLLGVGGDLRFGELPDDLPERLVLTRQLEVHGDTSDRRPTMRLSERSRAAGQPSTT